MLVFAFGFLVISQPVILTFIRTELELSDTQVGAIFTIGAVNGVFSALLIGYLAETRGFSFIVRWALGLVLVASVLYALPAAHASFWTVLCASFLFMLGLTGCFFAGNSIIAAVCERDKSRYLNYSHLFYCLGSLVSPPDMTGKRRPAPPFTGHIRSVSRGSVAVQFRNECGACPVMHSMGAKTRFSRGPIPGTVLV